MSSYTDNDIRKLQDEARAAGDSEMAVICAEALLGDPGAREECCLVMDAAKAMRDSDE